MLKEWSTAVFEVLPYKETGTFILKSPDEASQLLDDHIVMTQSMSFSPFKKPFEGRISTWESKLRITQVHFQHSQELRPTPLHTQFESLVLVYIPKSNMRKIK